MGGQTMIYVTGDMHGTAEYGPNRLSLSEWPEGRELTRNDTVIVAGDFGYVWDGSHVDDYWLDWLEERPWTTCFVDGNHENHELLAAMPERAWNGGRVHEVRPHVLHLMRGQVFDLEGVRIFTMGGASSHDRAWREEGESWWPGELPSDAERSEALGNLDACGWAVDYIITHEAPLDLASELSWECNRPFDGGDVHQRFLQEVDDRLSYRTWFFGHYHDDEWRDDRHRLIYRDIVPIAVRRADEDREPIGAPSVGDKYGCGVDR